MSDWYYARDNNGTQEAVGPYDDVAFQSMFSSGLLPPGTLVYHPTIATQWTPMSAIIASTQSPPPSQQLVPADSQPLPVVQEFRPRTVTRRQQHTPRVQVSLSPGAVIAIVGSIFVLVIAGKIALDEYRLMRAKQEIGKAVDQFQKNIESAASGGVTERVKADGLRHALEYLRRHGFDELSKDTIVGRSGEHLVIAGYARKRDDIQSFVITFHVTAWTDRQVWKMVRATINDELMVSVDDP